MHAVEAGYPVKDGSNEVFIKWKSAGRTCPCRSHSCAAIHDARAETAWFYCWLHGRILRYADRDGLLVLPADPASQILTCHHEHENTHALNAGPIWAGIRFRGCLKKGSIQIFNRSALQRADRTPGLEHIHPARIMPQPRRYGWGQGMCPAVAVLRMRDYGRDAAPFTATGGNVSVPAGPVAQLHATALFRGRWRQATS